MMEINALYVENNLKKHSNYLPTLGMSKINMHSGMYFAPYQVNFDHVLDASAD